MADNLEFALQTEQSVPWVPIDARGVNREMEVTLADQVMANLIAPETQPQASVVYDTSYRRADHYAAADFDVTLASRLSQTVLPDENTIECYLDKDGRISLLVPRLKPNKEVVVEQPVELVGPQRKGILEAARGWLRRKAPEVPVPAIIEEPAPIKKPVKLIFKTEEVLGKVKTSSGDIPTDQVTKIRHFITRNDDLVETPSRFERGNL